MKMATILPKYRLRLIPALRLATLPSEMQLDRLREVVRGKTSDVLDALIVSYPLLNPAIFPPVVRLGWKKYLPQRCSDGTTKQYVYCPRIMRTIRGFPRIGLSEVDGVGTIVAYQYLQTPSHTEVLVSRGAWIVAAVFFTNPKPSSHTCQGTFVNPSKSSLPSLKCHLSDHLHFSHPSSCSRQVTVDSRVLRKKFRASPIPAPQFDNITVIHRYVGRNRVKSSIAEHHLLTSRARASRHYYRSSTRSMSFRLRSMLPVTGGTIPQYRYWEMAALVAPSPIYKFWKARHGTATGKFQYSNTGKLKFSRLFQRRRESDNP
ncbi:hypothetical protein BD779DRAFT_1530922 [Infundibulicybe gibba]|nr:hypothetical protein BD779DRAFT_1530922 [Infundibulicybe gibba]